MTIANSNKTNISLILLDEDPIFTLGLKEICKSEEYTDVNITATGKVKDIYSLIKRYQVDLWVVALDFDRFSTLANKFINSIPKLTQEYPQLNLVIIVNPESFVNDFQQITMIKGCCYKYTDIDELINTFRVCARGEIYFSTSNISTSKNRRFNTWFCNQCNIGINQISNQINELNSYTKSQQLATIDLIYWQGRKRELKLTKWLIEKALPKNRLNLPEDLSNNSISLQKQPSEAEKLVNTDTDNSQIILSDQPFSTYNFALAKINNSLINLTGKIQETDILKPTKKKELFITILQQWYQLIAELKNNNVSDLELIKNVNSEVFIKQLYQDLLSLFLGNIIEEKAVIKYQPSTILPENINLNVYDLEKIYFWEELILYQVLERDFLVDDQIYQYGSEEAQEIEAIVLENLIISIANYMMQYVLNNFYDNLNLKDKLFEKELKSSRKVAMFRNNLDWKYRQEKYWRNPTNIFEDKYEMLKFTYRGMEIIKIHHSRHLELNQIRGIPWLVTILIELRDSLARGVRAFGDTLGQIIVYLLTEVIGRGIGLIGKGILQGIGSRIKN